MSNVEVHVHLVIEVTTKHCRSDFIKGQTLMANIFVKLASVPLAKIDVFEMFFFSACLFTHILYRQVYQLALTH